MKHRQVEQSLDNDLCIYGNLVHGQCSVLNWLGMDKMLSQLAVYWKKQLKALYFVAHRDSDWIKDLNVKIKNMEILKNIIRNILQPLRQGVLGKGFLA